MTVSRTSNRIAFAVPSPWTFLAIGKKHHHQNDRDVRPDAIDYSGVIVNTDEHVRLYAEGDRDASDAIGQATGRVWLQAKRDLVAMAQRTLLLRSENDTYLASGGTLTVLAGFAKPQVRSEREPGAMPKAIEGYDAKVTLASTIWGGFDVAMTALTVVAASVEGALTGSFSWAAASTTRINTIGTAVNIVGLGWSKAPDLPGLHLFSETGTYFQSMFGVLTVSGLMGALMGGLVVNVVAAVSGKLRGVARASVAAVDTVDAVSAFWWESRAERNQTIAARTGALALRGAKITVGTTKTKGKQLPTLTACLSSVRETSVETPTVIGIQAAPLKGSVPRVSLLTSSVGDTTIEATGKILYQCKGMIVSVLPTEITFGDHRPFMKLTDASVEVAYAPQLKCAPGKIVGGMNQLVVVPGGAITLGGAEVEIG
ncbi:MAG: hypothetical protein H6719_26230 [Sandaracinaceae bacterium]|nr:hypothetical protein [Sandaracinaceae bacterium]